MAILGDTKITNLELLNALPLAQGGTGATTAANARTNLGLGSLSTKSSASGNFTPAGSVSTPTITVTPSTTSVGSASAGTAIPADDITAWTTNVPMTASASQGVLTLTAGTAASLSYTAKSIPNISVSSKTVMTGATASSSQPTFTGTQGTVSVS